MPNGTDCKTKLLSLLAILISHDSTVTKDGQQSPKTINGDECLHLTSNPDTFKHEMTSNTTEQCLKEQGSEKFVFVANNYRK